MEPILIKFGKTNDLRLSPNFERMVTRTTKHYQFSNTADINHHPVVVEHENLSYQGDYFFLNEHLVAIESSDENWHAILRATDGSILCFSKIPKD